MLPSPLIIRLKLQQRIHLIIETFKQVLILPRRQLAFFAHISRNPGRQIYITFVRRSIHLRISNHQDFFTRLRSFVKLTILVDLISNLAALRSCPLLRFLIRKQILVVHIAWRLIINIGSFNVTVVVVGGIIIQIMIIRLINEQVIFVLLVHRIFTAFIVRLCISCDLIR